MRRDIRIIICLLSAAMGFGTYDPIFGTDSQINSTLIICTLFIIYSSFASDILLSLKYYKYVISALLMIPLLFFIGGLNYGYAFYGKELLNIKLVIAIILFWFLSYFFKSNPKLCVQSLLIFSIACSLLAIAATLGLLGTDSYVIVNGRALLLGENPNSTSSRMAIAAIFIGYVCLENPLKYRRTRFLLLLFLPALFILIIQSASRGSFLSLLIGYFILLLFSNVSVKVKFLALVVCSVVLIILFNSLQEEIFILDRFYTTVEEGSIGQRSEIWDHALTIFYEHPFIGVGEAGYFDEIFKRMSVYLDTHNIFLYLLVSGGFFAFFIFSLFIINIFKNVLMNLKYKNSFPLIFFIFILLIAVKTGGVITYLIMWYIYAVLYSFNINTLHAQISFSSNIGAQSIK